MRIHGKTGGKLTLGTPNQANHVLRNALGGSKRMRASLTGKTQFTFSHLKILNANAGWGNQGNEGFWGWDAIRGRDNPIIGFIILFFGRT